MRNTLRKMRLAFGLQSTLRQKLESQSNRTADDWSTQKITKQFLDSWRKNLKLKKEEKYKQYRREMLRSKARDLLARSRLEFELADL